MKKSQKCGSRRILENAIRSKRTTQLAEEICTTTDDVPCVMHRPIIKQHQEADAMCQKIKTTCLQAKSTLTSTTTRLYANSLLMRGNFSFQHSRGHSGLVPPNLGHSGQQRNTILCVSRSISLEWNPPSQNTSISATHSKRPKYTMKSKTTSYYHQEHYVR